MASKMKTYKTVDGEIITVQRSKQGRRPSVDPRIPVTVRIPKSWLDDLQDVRHEITVALYEYRTRKLVKH